MNWPLTFVGGLYRLTVTQITYFPYIYRSTCRVFSVRKTRKLGRKSYWIKYCFILAISFWNCGTKGRSWNKASYSSCRCSIFKLSRDNYASKQLFQLNLLFPEILPNQPSSRAIQNQNIIDQTKTSVYIVGFSEHLLENNYWFVWFLKLRKHSPNSLSVKK